MAGNPMQVAEGNEQKKRSKWRWIAGGVGIVAVIAVVIALAVHFSRKKSDPHPDPEPEPEPEPEPGWEREQSKVDCFLEDKWGTTRVTQELCEERGCIYEEAKLDGVPSCFMASHYSFGEKVETEKGFNVTLNPRETNRRKRRAITPEKVKLSAEFYGADVLRIKISHADKERYEVPESVVPLNLFSGDYKRPSQPAYRVDVSDNSFQVVRETGNISVFNTSVGGLLISDQLLTISTRLPSSNVYGFGENSHKTFRHDLNHTSWGMFARDQWVGTGIHNHYSVHPFYTCLEENGYSHGVLFLNSNAMDYTFTPLPMLTFRSIGGVLDLYFFMGPTPENVVQQYTGVIGRPYFPPYWSLGFQLCRYGYNNLTRLQEAVNRTRDAEIPQDVQYADIDHYDERKVFTVDNDTFGGLPEYFEYLREEGMHTIIILDPCLISNETGYEPYDRSREKDGNIKWPSREAMPEEDFLETNSTDMLGFVWPIGKVVFPDFFLSETEDLWSDLIVKHWDVIKFDGLWIDMNEPANFGTNDDRPWNWPEDYTPYWSLKCPEGTLDDPPYRTMASFVYDAEMMQNQNRSARLSDKTLCMSATQGRGQYKHYDVHSLYGPSQIKSTLRGLRTATEQNKRGLVVSRSTFPGSGKNSGHWLGDNFSQWPALKESIVGMLEFNLFGFPYIGADICGFFGDTNAQMCMRWQQLGAFYPYSRNHNQIDSPIDQDPANFDELTTAKSREAMLIRYKLLPYLYTLFYKAHTEGSTVVRPVFHEFSHDSNTWGIDEQFLWGSALLISPILYENQTALSYYLPAGVWYDYYTGEGVHTDTSAGANYTIPVFLNSSIPLHMRGGNIIPTQEPAMNTVLSRKNPFSILAYLDDREEADGDMFWDDGETADTIESDMFGLWTFSVKQNEFNMFSTGRYNNLSSLESVVIYGLTSAPDMVSVNGTSNHTDFTYKSKVFNIFGLDWKMDDNVTITWH